MNGGLLRVENLRRYYSAGGLAGRGVIKAVDGVSLSVNAGETFGLVGESGCGKTTLGKTILRLGEPTGGKIFFEGRDITRGDITACRKSMQMIFQDPFSSLDPRMTVGDIIGEPLDIHKLCRGKKERAQRVSELLDMVGLSPGHAGRYPHEFSGGQRQRVSIARALAARPAFVVCDEPVSALDVSIQAQIINMLEDMQARLGLTYLFISHDISVVRHISDRVGVMYLGRLVELAGSAELCGRPAHPYTRALISAVPAFAGGDGARPGVPVGEPSPRGKPQGCRFAPRCPEAAAACAAREPELREISPGHLCACHFAGGRH